MFDFFKRSADRPIHPKNTRATRTTRPAPAMGALDPLPVPDVTEGNSEADWSAWEDSVAFQDNQMSGFGASKPPPTPNEHPGDTVPDTFSQVHKHSP